MLTCHLPPEYLDAQAAYERALHWVARRSAVDACFREWWLIPGAPKAPFLPLTNAALAIASVAESDLRMDKEYTPSNPAGSMGLLLTNAGNGQQWKQRGKLSFRINPATGTLHLRLYSIETVYESPGAVVWSLLKALCADPRVKYAKTNVQQLVAGSLLLYSADRAVYPHREFIGWMGYVRKVLAQSNSLMHRGWKCSGVAPPSLRPTFLTFPTRCPLSRQVVWSVVWLSWGCCP